MSCQLSTPIEIVTHLAPSTAPLLPPLIEPAQDLTVRGVYIELKALCAQRRRQRHEEAALKLAVEALDFAFGPSATRTTYAQLRANVTSASLRIPPDVCL